MEGLEQKQLEEERYQMLYDAFYELVAKEVSTEALQTLRFETGFFQKDFDRIVEEVKNALV